MTELRVVTLLCTGNICRSPMAWALLHKHLRTRGVVDVDLRSAGTHATTGSPAMRAAIVAAKKLGADCATHRATFLDGALARESHLILAATQDHVDHVLLEWRDVEPCRVRLFNEALGDDVDPDVADPYGWDDGVYERASLLIDAAMQGWAARLAAGTELDPIAD